MTQEIDLSCYTMVSRSGVPSSIESAAGEEDLFFSDTYINIPPARTGHRDYLAYARENPVQLYEEEDVLQGVTPAVISAVQLEMSYQYVEDYASVDTDVGELASRLHKEIVVEKKQQPTFVHSTSDDKGRMMFHATIRFDGGDYAVGPCCAKKDLNREFLRQYFAKGGKYVLLMSRYMTDVLDYVVSLRQDAVKWNVGGGITVLEIRRADHVQSWQSTLPGVRGVAQCCHKYLRDKMGYLFLTGLRQVPGYPAQSSVMVWQQLLGEITNQEVYDYLRHEMITNADQRIPEGGTMVEGRDMRLCVESRMDYYDLVRHNYKKLSDVMAWLQRRYGYLYSTTVSSAVLKYEKFAYQEKERIVQERFDDSRVDLNGDRLVRGIVRALDSCSIGMRMNEIQKELSRTWNLDVCDLGITLRKYLDVKWTLEVENGIPRYYLIRVFNDRVMRQGDDVCGVMPKEGKKWPKGSVTETSDDMRSRYLLESLLFEKVNGDLN